MTSNTVKVVRPVVRRVTFLWGGAGVDAQLSSGLILCFRVPDEGEPIVFGVTKNNPRREIRLGRLEAGESFSVPLNGISGVYARTTADTHDTYVECELVRADESDRPRLSGVLGL
jgi:hypothetical protein